MPSSPTRGADEHADAALVLVEAAPSGAGQGLVLPQPTDTVWQSVPAALTQSLAMTAYQLTSPLRGPLAAPSGRKLRAALQAAVRGRITGAHWRVLLTAPRAAFGGPRSARADQAYALLQEVVADHLRPTLAAAATARFNTAMELTTSQPSAPAVAHSTSAPASTAAASSTEPDAAAAASKPIAPSSESQDVSVPAAPAAVPAPTASRPSPEAPRAAASAAAAPFPAVTVLDHVEPTTAGPAPDEVPSIPTTLHQARSRLPELIKTAAAGQPTPLTRGPHHALLITPAAAHTLGWDLIRAEAHGIADARKRLGDLIQAAAEGRPQVLRRHVTPVAVLVPATPDGIPVQAAQFTAAPSGDAPATSATAAPSAVPTQPDIAQTPPTAAEPPAPAAPSADAPVPAATPGSTTPDAPAAPATLTAPVPAPSAPAADAAPPAAAVPASTTTPREDALTPASAAAEHADPAAPDAAVSTLPAAAALPATSWAPRRLAPLAKALDAVLAPTSEDEPTTHVTPFGLPTGIRTLDNALGGLQPGRFYVIAAAPGAGSSLIASAAARTTALDHHQPVLYAASGLTRADVAARIVAAHLPVDYRRLRTGRLTPTEQTNVAALHEQLTEAPLFIDDGADLDPAAIAESVPDIPGLALIVVDRLQTVADPRLPLSGTDRIRDAAQALAHLARTHRIPIIAAVDTDTPDLVAALGLDVTLTLTRDTDQIHARLTERDLGTQATLTLHADLTHARITDPPTHPGRQNDTTTAPSPEASSDTASTATAPARHPTAPTAPAPTTAPRHAPAAKASPATTGGYAGRDYSYFTDMITREVDRALSEHAGDVEAATQALVKKAVPKAMALFEATRVGANYEHSVYPETLEFLRKKKRDGVDEIWEGRHNWTNLDLMDALNSGALPPASVDALDTNASFLSAFKTWLPIGALVHQPDGGYDPKRSGIYLLPTRPTWHHPDLPDPIGNRHEDGPILLDDATIRLLLRCAKLGLCEAPHITECWTSGASENLLEKFRRVLTEAREKAIQADDTVTVEYIKAMYSKFVSTIGESSANLDIRRPDWMHIIRSQAFANLWYKAYRAHKMDLTVVRVRGTDELHVTGGDWRTVFEEGRATTQMKLKDGYTLPRTRKTA